MDQAEGFSEFFAPFLKPDTQLTLAQRNAIRTAHLIVNNPRVTMPGYLSPGLYYENGNGSPLDPWRQFQADCGGCIVAVYLAYAVRAVLEDGGKCCTVVRAASRDEFPGLSMANTLFGPAGQPDRSLKSGRFGKPIKQFKRPGCTRPRQSRYPRERIRMICQSSQLQDLIAAGRWVATILRGFTGGWRYKASAARRLTQDVPLLRPLGTPPIRAESILYPLIVWEAGRRVETHRQLAIIPGHPHYGRSLLAPRCAALEPSQYVRATRADNGIICACSMNLLSGFFR